MNLSFDVVNCVQRLNLEGGCLNKDLHATVEMEDEEEGEFFLDVVVRECITVLKLIAGENKTLLVRWNTACSSCQHVNSG